MGIVVGPERRVLTRLRCDTIVVAIARLGTFEEDTMKEPGIERVAVIGAGLMGFGVGVEFARFGYEVALYNRREETSREAMERSREALDLMAETELITAAEAYPAVSS